jgi:hypothetical protein
MLIRWTVTYRTRILGDYTWSQSAGFVQDVTDAATALDALTSRGFEIDESDPIVMLFGREAAEDLVAEGICTMDALTGIGKSRLRELAERPALKPVVEWARTAQPAEETETNKETDEVN